MAKFNELTTAQIRQALEYREQIESLQEKLDALFGGIVPATKPGKKRGRPPGKGKRTMSPEARAKIAAAQKARWAKTRGK